MAQTWYLRGTATALSFGSKPAGYYPAYFAWNNAYGGPNAQDLSMTLGSSVKTISYSVVTGAGPINRYTVSGQWLTPQLADQTIPAQNYSVGMGYRITTDVGTPTYTTHVRLQHVSSTGVLKNTIFDAQIGDTLLNKPVQAGSVVSYAASVAGISVVVSQGDYLVVEAGALINVPSGISPTVGLNQYYDGATGITVDYQSNANPASKIVIPTNLVLYVPPVGTAPFSIPKITSSATGTMTPPTITGTAALILPEATLTSIGHLNPQTAYPIADITVDPAFGEFGTMWSELDDENGSSSIDANVNESFITYEGLLTPLETPVSTSHPHVVNYNIGSYGITQFDVGIYDGATLIANWISFGDGWYPTYDQVMSPAQAAAIVDYTNLRARIRARAYPTAPSYVAAGAMVNTATFGAGLSPVPPTIAVNDILVLVAGISANTDFNHAVTGWTKFTPGGVAENNTSALRVECWWRRATGSGDAPTLATMSSSSVRTARIFAVRGCLTTGDPFIATDRVNNAASATVTFPSVDTGATERSLSVLAFVYEDDPVILDWVSGFTLMDVAGTTTGNDQAQGMGAWRVNEGGGVVTGGTANVIGGTFTDSPSVGLHFVFAHKPHTDSVFIGYVKLTLPEPLPIIYAGASLTTSWDTAGVLVGKSLATSWDVAPVITGVSLATSWNVAGVVGVSLTTTWDVAPVISGTSLATTWDVAGIPAGKSLATTWDVADMPSIYIDDGELWPEIISDLNEPQWITIVVPTGRFTPLAKGFVDGSVRPSIVINNTRLRLELTEADTHNLGATYITRSITARG